MMTFQWLGAALLLLCCGAQAQTCPAAARPHLLGERIARAALTEYAEFNGHRIDAQGYLWKSGSAESETELLLDPDSGVADASRSGRFAWRRVWEYWLTLERHAPGEALSRRVIAVPGLLDHPATAKKSVQPRLQDIFSKFAADDKTIDTALKQSAVRAALNDSPWSAAFISYLMSQADMTARQFRYAPAHWQYIQAAFEQPQGYAYRACDPARTVPAVGDLLCYSRDASSLTSFAQWRQASGRPDFSVASHCEVVVEVNTDSKKMEVIGGNVMQSVARRRLKLNARNLLSETYRPRRLQTSAGRECARDPTCHQPNLNMQHWSVLLQLQ